MLNLQPICKVGLDAIIKFKNLSIEGLGLGFEIKGTSIYLIIFF
jgi:hypothetical protein